MPRVGGPDGASVIRVTPPTLEDSQSVIVIRDPSALSQDSRTAHLPDSSLIEKQRLWGAADARS